MTRQQPDVVNLGVDPVYRMLRGDPPFHGSGLGPVGTAHQDVQEIRSVGTWAFQFHTYLGMIETAHGPEVRDEVRKVILLSLNQNGTTGDQMERFLKITREAVESHNRDQSRVAGNIGVSVEGYLAIMLLLKVNDSPYFIGRQGAAEANDDPGLHFDLLQDLSRSFARGADRVRKFYRQRLDRDATLDPACRWARCLKQRVSGWTH